MKMKNKLKISESKLRSIVRKSILKESIDLAEPMKYRISSNVGFDGFNIVNDPKKYSYDIQSLPAFVKTGDVNFEWGTYRGRYSNEIYYSVSPAMLGSIQRAGDPYTYDEDGDSFKIISAPEYSKRSIGTKIKKGTVAHKKIEDGFANNNISLIFSNDDIHRQLIQIFKSADVAKHADLPPTVTPGIHDEPSNEHVQLIQKLLNMPLEQQTGFWEQSTDDAWEAWLGDNLDFAMQYIPDFTVDFDGSYQTDWGSISKNSNYSSSPKGMIKFILDVNKGTPGIDIDNLMQGSRIPLDMFVSNEFKAQLKAHEGFRGHVYDDKNGKAIANYEDAKRYPTIGWGHLVYKKGTKDEREKYRKYLKGGVTMSEAEAESLLDKDIESHVKIFKAQITVPITQNMFDALASYAFNTGAYGPKKYGIIDRINAGDYEGAAAIMKTTPVTSKGVKSAGLVSRRKKEAALFMQGHDQADLQIADAVPPEGVPDVDSDEYVLIGDSQVNAGIGRAIKSTFGNPASLFQKHGQSPAGILALYGDKIPEALSSTSKVIVTLGGNGSDGAEDLANLILASTPSNADITWILAPPAVKATNQEKTERVFGKKAWPARSEQATVSRLFNKRNITNNEIENSIASVDLDQRINVINPYDTMTKYYKSGPDGIHVPGKVGEKFVKSISV